ncbi:ATP-binding protein [Ningiella sp. W23]|uniref:ATP-binding protein n=1 Tax=Ningiella sp. W23 TaxID=3023715 RepID=UPI0037563517
MDLQIAYQNSQKGKGKARLLNHPTANINSCSFYGIPGDGKSTSFERILALQPQAIYHEKYNFLQITYLVIEFPHDGSLVTLCHNFFESLNKATGERDTQWFERRENEKSLLRKMQRAASRFHIGLLVIDEFQSWRKAKRGGEAVLGFLVNLINTIRLPVIFAGTPAGIGKLEENLAMARRVVGFDFWDPLDSQKKRNGEKNNCKKLWEHFTNTLWHYQYLDKPKATLTDEIRNTWFDLSQGVLDIAIKLFIYSQLRAIRSKTEVITLELMRQVYKEDLKPVHNALAALRSNDPARIADFEDLPQAKLKSRMTELQSSIIKSNNDKASTTLTLPGLNRELLEICIHLGINKEFCLPLINDFCSNNPKMSAIEAFPFLTQLIEERKCNQKTNVKEKRPRIQINEEQFLSQTENDPFQQLQR